MLLGQWGGNTTRPLFKLSIFIIKIITSLVKVQMLQHGVKTPPERDTAAPAFPRASHGATLGARSCWDLCALHPCPNPTLPQGRACLPHAARSTRREAAPSGARSGKFTPTLYSTQTPGSGVAAPPTPLAARQLEKVTDGFKILQVSPRLGKHLISTASWRKLQQSWTRKKTAHWRGKGDRLSIGASGSKGEGPRQHQGHTCRILANLLWL